MAPQQLFNYIKMIKSFNEIAASERLSFAHILNNHGQYWAHTRKTGEKDEHETLNEHTCLVMDYALRICEYHGLEKVVENMCLALAQQLAPTFKKEFANFAKKLFLGTIAFHDAGKVNENFQREKMINPAFGRKVENSIGSDHAILSVIVFLAEAERMMKEIEWIENKDIKYGFRWLFLSFAEVIKQHHQSLRNATESLFDHRGNTLFIEDLTTYLDEFIGLSECKSEVQKLGLKTSPQKINNELRLKTKVVGKYDEQFELYALTKLCFSVLTAADYLGTNEYMLGIRVEDFGVIGEDLRQQMYKGVNDKNTFYSISNCKNPTPLNTLRLQLSDSALATLKNNLVKKLFYLEAPTGSGKTHTSLLLSAEILKNRPDLNKLCYVFPFTTLATQTFKSINDTLQLSEGEMAEIHSKAPFYSKSINSDEVIEEYGSERRSYLDALFVNFPICLMTHVKFFGGLLSNEKEQNYLLHRLANSVVIIDEIQSYPIRQWNTIAYTLQKYAEAFNIVFIVMSATLPKIGNLLSHSEQNLNSFTSLIEDKQEYFSNEVFAKRVEFNDEILRKSKTITPKELLPLVEKRVAEFQEEKIGARVMIEFLTKKSAREFYNLAQKSDLFENYQIFLLSGTILEPRRREIIDTIKQSKETDTILLVCTQVVEAGVDIDMDIGFKDISIIDSEEQCAGRINRNALKTNSVLYLFRTGEASLVYKNDKDRSTFKLLEKQAMNILKTKDFDKAYQQVFETIEKDKNNDLMNTKFKDFRKGIAQLDFYDVRKSSEIINDQTISVFVPLELSVQYFSMVECEFLSDCISEGIMDGYLVWERYKKEILGTRKENKSFIDRAAILKRLSSAMSKFTFSVRANQVTYLIPYSQGSQKNDYLSYGYLYLVHFRTDNIYSFNDGLGLDAESLSNFF